MLTMVNGHDGDDVGDDDDDDDVTVQVALLLNHLQAVNTGGLVLHLLGHLIRSKVGL